MKLLFFLIFLSISTYAASSNNPSINISPVNPSYSEGDSRTTQVTLNVNASICPDKKNITVDWFTRSGTAIQNEDFIENHGEITFLVGATSCNSDITVFINGDESLENDEDFTVTLEISANSAQNFTSGTLTSTVTIQNDDSVAQIPPILNTIVNQVGVENTAFTLDISEYTAITNSDPILSYTLNGTLPSGLDFNTSTGVISGTPTQTGSFDLNTSATDDDGESNIETFILTISSSEEEVSVDNADDLCYSTITTDGICGGFFSLNCTSTISIQNLNDVNLSSVNVVLGTGNDFGNFTDCGVNETSGDCADAQDLSIMGESSHNSGIIYSLSNYIGTQTQSVYNSAEFSFLDTSYDFLGTYTKNDIVHTGAISSCGIISVSDPDYAACGVFPSALNTWDTITSGNNDQVVYAETIYANNGVTNSVGCLDHVPVNNGDKGTECNVGSLDISPPSLPNFVNSLVNTEVTLSGTQTNDQYGDVTIASDTSVVFSPVSTYSDSSTKIMLMKSLTLHSGSTATFNAGDYYIGEWSSASDLTIRTNGAVRLFINSNMTLNNNHLDFNYDSGNGDASDMYIFVGGNFAMTSSGGGAGYNMTAYIYTKGTFNAGVNTANSSFIGAITAVGSITLNNNQIYIYDEAGLNGSGFGECAGSGNPPILGRFDAWDTGGGVDDRDIITKVVNTPFILDIVALSEDRQLIDTNSSIEVKYQLYDYTNMIGITNFTNLDLGTGTGMASITFDSSNILQVSSYKDLRVRFKFCQSKTSGALALETLCSSDPTNYEHNTSVASTDNFAIRPNKFSTDLPSNLVAGQGTEFTFYAYDTSNSSSTIAYNETENTSFVVDVNISDPAKTCQDMNIAFSPSIHFSDGNVTNEYTLNNVGDFNITMQEILGSEYALVDEDDTSVDTRLITPYTTQITVLPHHFDIDGNLSNGSNGFTYLNNFEGNASLDQNISALLSWDVIAKGETNVTTTNYTNTCYAKDGNLTLTLVLSQTSPNLSKLLYYDNDTLVLGENPIAGPYLLPDYTKDRFVTGDSNGTGTFTYRLNFDRNLTKVVNPFQMDISNLRVDDNNSVTGNDIIDNNATYVYGRTNAGRQRYLITNNGELKNANLYHEIYCFGTTNVNNNCNTSLLPSLNRTSDIRWYQNTDHNSSRDGNISSVVHSRGTNDVNATTPDETSYPSKTKLQYNSYASKGYPFRTTMDINTSTWLIYNENNPAAKRNAFQVEFEQAGNWSGEYETTTTIQDDQVNIKTNRRSMW